LGFTSLTGIRDAPSIKPQFPFSAEDNFKENATAKLCCCAISSLKYQEVSKTVLESLPFFDLLTVFLLFFLSLHLHSKRL
jgi:hypothetical protein